MDLSIALFKSILPLSMSTSDINKKTIHASLVVFLLIISMILIGKLKCKPAHIDKGHSFPLKERPIKQRTKIEGQ